MADGGPAALRALQEAGDRHQPFSLVLLDANVSEMGGSDVARQICERAQVAGTTIVAVSSPNQNGERARSAELGIACSLTKPVDQMELLRAIGRALTPGQLPRAAVPSVLMPADLPTARLDVLLAEDNAVNQRLAASLLERRGHRVTTVPNGRDALAAIEAHAFDVVLMDVQMPEMGGLEATAAIRRHERGTRSYLPIVAMTAHAMKGDRERCLGAGMDEYLTKPLDPTQLYEAVERVSNGSTKAACLHAPATSGMYEAVLARVGGDVQLLADISRLFVNELPGHLEQIRSALDARDALALRRAAHGLKGAAANFEASTVVDAARTLEEIGRSGKFVDDERAWIRLTTEASLLAGTLQTYSQSAAS